MKKTLTVFMLMLAFALVLAACSSDNGGKDDGKKQTNAEKNNSGNKEGSKEGSSDPVKITMFTSQGTNYNLQTNWFTQLAEEKFNIDFNFQTTTWDATAAAEQRKIALASGDYPDLFMMIPWVDQFSATELIQYGQQGVLLPLNDLIKEHAPNLQNVLDTHSFYKAMSTAPDGNIYGLPQLIDCFHCQHGPMYWVQDTWRQELGFEKPTTTEELRAYLTAVKTGDPNGNGKADEVPLTGHLTSSILPFLMNAFIYDDNKSRILVNDGELSYAPVQEGWKNGLTYVKSLYDEGLIDPGAFTQNQDAFNQLANNGEAMLIGIGTALPSNLDYQKNYDILAPISGPDGTKFVSFGSTSTVGAAFALTNKASEEAQIAAIKLVDYLFTEEGQMLGYLGKEGSGWRQPEPGELALDADADPLFFRLSTPAGQEHHNTDWAAIAQYYQPREFRDRWVADADIYTAGGFPRRLQEAAYLYENLYPEQIFPYWALWYDPAIVDEFAMLETNIRNYVEQNTLQFITGSKNLEGEWDSYVKGLDQLNLKRYLEIQKQAYDLYQQNQ